MLYKQSIYCALNLLKSLALKYNYFTYTRFSNGNVIKFYSIDVVLNVKMMQRNIKTEQVPHKHRFGYCEALHSSEGLPS